jgi:hypothetical protein
VPPVLLNVRIYMKTLWEMMRQPKIATPGKNIHPGKFALDTDGANLVTHTGP